ncbi:MAG: cupredoxin domain-containing protein [Nitrospirota bacterium]
MLSFRIGRQDVLFILLACILLFSCSGCTMTVHAFVQDENGNPVQNAVVFATAPQGGVPVPPPAAGGAGVAKRETIDLIDQKIVPLVTPVHIGTAVSFSNKDAIQHQIYSISPAKQFRLTIDRGTSSAEMAFDKPGVVVMGSAINDRMIGYIYVLKTPWFATTGADGKADLRDLPKGAYDVFVWHPNAKRPPEATVKRLTLYTEKETKANFSLALHPAQGPAAGGI